MSVCPLQNNDKNKNMKKTTTTTTINKKNGYIAVKGVGVLYQPK